MTDVEFTAVEFRISLEHNESDMTAQTKLAMDKWEKSESGKWLTKNADIICYRCLDFKCLTMNYRIKATLPAEKYTFWSLKYK